MSQEQHVVSLHIQNRPADLSELSAFLTGFGRAGTYRDDFFDNTPLHIHRFIRVYFVGLSTTTNSGTVCHLWFNAPVPPFVEDYLERRINSI